MPILLIVVIIGLIPAYIASNKGRSFFLWWLYGGAIFIAALPHALLIDPNENAPGKKKCPQCAEIINKEANICPNCGTSISTKIDANEQKAKGNNSGMLTAGIVLLILSAIIFFIFAGGNLGSNPCSSVGDEFLVGFGEAAHVYESQDDCEYSGSPSGEIRVSGQEFSVLSNPASGPDECLKVEVEDSHPRLGGYEVWVKCENVEKEE
ncbi:zinc ribbon domain-containing protein [Candidatus Bipolaricaulota bacterium]|nr:zinc ribbon domain-containing protein [Candidatus Bipolaricaulota bacterium]